MTALSRLVRAANWKYAIGEVLLVFVGIMLALAANSWNENRNDRQEEKELLSQLKAALEVDKETLESNLAILQQVEMDVGVLVRHMDSDEPFTDDLIPLFGRIPRWVSIGSMTAPYEALKSRGLGLISDNALQLNIIYYYETQFRLVENSYLNSREFSISSIYPFMRQNFRLDSGTGWVPLDYENLRSNEEFRNLCVYRLNRLTNFQFPFYNEALDTNRQLIQQIDEHSARL